MGSEPSPFIIGIRIKTAPVKTHYRAGELINMADSVLYVEWSNGLLSELIYGTEGVTYSPAEGTPFIEGTTRVVISYKGFTCEQSLTEITVSGIAVSTPPTKTTYSLNEAVDLTGLKITATWTEGPTTEVDYNSPGVTCVPAHGSTITEVISSIAIAYKGKSTTQSITIRDLQSITLKTSPKTDYSVVEDIFNLSGLVVTAHFADGDEDIS